MSLTDYFPDVRTNSHTRYVPKSPIKIPAETENNETSPDKATSFVAEDSEMSADRGACLITTHKVKKVC